MALDALADQPELAGTLELVWRQAQASLPPQRLPDWLAACRALASRLGANAALAYIRNSPSVAASAGAESALALADAAPGIAALAGPGAALALLVAAPAAARRLAAPQAFAEWLRILHRIAERAPESVSLLLERSERVLAALDLRSLESWALGGIRAAEHDAERRLKFFALLDPAALRSLAQGDDLPFTAVERELRAYVRALFRRAPPLRTLPPSGLETPRRAGFDHGVIRLPESFRGVAGAAAKELYRAALAHILAHFRFTPAKFPVGSLKPVQVALVSLIEDARVEQLALALYPGLRRLWQPFHLASPAGAATAPALMARLSRALLDPAHADDHFWVRKGRELFFAESARWQDPALSRALGGLLGNDLGQMRAQFNARTYAVEPLYRDDNQGLWDFPAAAAPDEAEAALEAMRFDTAEDAPAEREAGEAEAANRASPVAAAAEIGLPVARYPEWDFLIGSERADWTTILEYPPAEADARRIDAILERYPEQIHRIAALIRAAKLSRPQRLRRQSEGDRLDLEAAIAAAIDRRLGLAPSPKVYARLERRWRDLSVLLLLDASHSTNDVVRGAGRSVLELERDAASLLAHAMDGLGDPFAIHAFCSDTRADVHYYRLKEFDAPYGEAAKRRLAGLSGRFSTRMGAALRHAGRELAGRLTYRRLLLMISDGEPSDVDIADRRYLVEDARRAVLSLRHRGVDVFCVALDAGGDAYLTRIFGRRNVLQLDRIERLPDKLPLLYFRLAG
ncbi:MAG: nitric oxide reductase activation protein NorD [Stellaceae bacterium]